MSIYTYIKEKVSSYVTSSNNNNIPIPIPLSPVVDMKGASKQQRWSLQFTVYAAAWDLRDKRNNNNNVYILYSYS